MEDQGRNYARRRLEGSRNSSPSASVSFPPECIRQGLTVFQQIQENETAAAIWYYNLLGLGEFGPPTDCHCLWLNGNVFSWIFISSWLCGYLRNYGRNTCPKLQTVMSGYAQPELKCDAGGLHAFWYKISSYFKINRLIWDNSNIKCTYFLE